ncbi:MAG: phosphoglycerate kinase [Hydrogenophilaceae bacterium]|jgi:phosphoglycerate kinase|nr:phosphoglycerate kinase [Hydrogenophilaceae bacterium]
MRFRRLDDADLQGKRALVRVDFNVPMAEGHVSDDTRLRAALPTIKALQAKGAKTILLAHFGRPKGKRDETQSLAPVAPALAQLLGAPVAFANDCIGETAKAGVDALAPGGVILLENTRFHAGEEKNDPELAKAIAALGDVYVNDAFSAAHRAHASTEGLAHLLPAYAGKSMEAELDHLEKALGNPARPVLAVVGGAKVSTKIDLLENLVSKVDFLAIGGAMANTFLFAKGLEVGKSLCERDLAETARKILAAAAKAGCEVLLPEDVVVAHKFEANAPHQTVRTAHVAAEDMILDAGPETVAHLAEKMAAAKTLIWNGPLGAFETPPFDRATVEAARAAGRLARDGKLIAVAGGGDTVAALNHAGVADQFTFVSTAGGAFLEWMEGKALPGVEALKA